MLQNDVQLRRQYIQLQKKNALIQIEQALWVMNYIKDRLKRDPAYMYRIEVLERIIANEKKLYSNTGLYRIMFDALLEKFEEFLRSSNDSPLFRIKSNRSSHPGNRCKLYPRYTLLITYPPQDWYIPARTSTDVWHRSKHRFRLSQIYVSCTRRDTALSKQNVYKDTKSRDTLRTQEDPAGARWRYSNR